MSQYSDKTQLFSTPIFPNTDIFHCSQI